MQDRVTSENNVYKRGPMLCEVFSFNQTATCEKNCTCTWSGHIQINNKCQIAALILHFGNFKLIFFLFTPFFLFLGLRINIEGHV